MVIVDSSEPVTLVGGADIGLDDLNIALSIAPRLVAADGGADHLLAAELVPDAIFGDLDSISEAAKTAFAPHLHRIEEQDSTDFAKVVRYVDAPLLLAVGFLGRRLDHTIAALHVAATHPDKPIVFLGSDDAVFLLKDKEIQIDATIGTGISVLPLMPSVVSTTGLKWNLQSARLSMSGLISSSNEVAGSTVKIAAEGTVAITLPKDHLQTAIDAVLAR